MAPNNREAEEGLLGSILIYPDAFYEVADLLEADDFYIHRHRWVWSAFASLIEKRASIDYLTITNELDRQDHLGDVGGAAYITQIISNTPSALHAVEYAKIVAEMATRRRMLEAANLVAKTAYDTGTPLEDSLNTAEGAIFNVAVTAKSIQRDLLPSSHFISQLYDDVTQSNKEKHPGIPTALIDLDKLLGGLRQSDLLVLAGRPGMGKTSLLLTLAANIAVETQKHTALFSLEMDGFVLHERLASQVGDIPLQHIRDHRMEDEDWAPFAHAVESISAAPLFVDDSPVLTPARLRTQCRRLAMEHGLDLVIIDYLQLMSGGQRFENRTQEVTYISRQLKILARELRVPVLASAQLSRAVERRQDKRPTLADLRESGAIEQDSDIVMFLYRDQNAEVTKLAVEKHRNGPTGIIDLVFRSEYTTFVNTAQ